MKTKYIVKGLFASLVMMLAFSSCETFNDAVVETLDVNRAFSPIGLTATVRNETAVELNWTVKPDADHYVVEFSADDPDFKVIYKTINVAPTELPVKVQLEGETVYAIRVKAISSTGLDASKWSVTSATTLSEQLFYPVVPADIEAKQVTLRWPANTNATQITLQPGGITHTITPAEKTAGVAVITGLTAETAYTANLWNGTKKRGTVTFTTGIDIGNGILVKAEDNNLLQKITDAPTGSVLVLMPGDYTAQTALVALNKTITIRGLRTDNKPKLKLNFTLANNPANASEVVNFSLIDVDLSGSGLTGAAIAISTEAVTQLGDVLISNSYVHDFPSQLMYGNAKAKLKSFTVDGSTVKNVNTAGSADFVDFRTTFVANVSLTKSTFDTCSSRDFIRMDVSSFSGTGLTSNVLIDQCTIYTPTLPLASRILYLRSLANASIVRNTLFAVGSAVYTNSSATAPPTFLNNNNFNSPNLALVGSNNRPDASATTLDPQFTNAAGGNFTVGNQAIKDKKIGDPKWIK
ncbi:DUF5123 domain-containing protein [Flavobacterium sp. 245]|uniref:DUF5123 domain-containing protein n=1 Tax=Flavobacterium sp. 245 TaxID=2512115 RepID=UPI001FB6B061|nr:DUF4957 domain-containing protein [Flavobacterium sp. 245]